MSLTAADRDALAPKGMLDRLRAGDQRPLHALYRVHRDPFVKWATIYHPDLDTEALSDAFQDALISFYENVISGKLPELRTRPQTYLFRLGERFCYHQKKKRGPIVKVFEISDINGEDDDEDPDSTDPMPILLDDPFALTDELDELDRQRDLIDRALHQLTADCRRILQAYYYADQKISIEKLSAELEHNSVEATMARKSYCLGRLRALCRSGLTF